MSLCTWVKVQPRKRVFRLAAVHAGLLHLLNLLLALRRRPCTRQRSAVRLLPTPAAENKLFQLLDKLLLLRQATRHTHLGHGVENDLILAEARRTVGHGGLLCVRGHRPRHARQHSRQASRPGCKPVKKVAAFQWSDSIQGARRSKLQALAVHSQVIFSQPMACLLQLANICDKRQDKKSC